MRLKKFTHTKVAQNLTNKKVKGYLYPNGRFTNGFMWLELPQEAVKKAQAKADKLNLETNTLPNLSKTIINYRQGQPTEAQLTRFYYDGMGWDQKEHRWYAEFTANGTIYSYDADHVLALEYASIIDKWLIFTEADSPVLEAWNGHCIGGVSPIIRSNVDEQHYKPATDWSQI